MCFVEVGLEAMRAVYKLGDTLGTIEGSFVVQHLLGGTSVVADGFVASSSRDSMHLPCFISDLNGSGVACASSVTRVRPLHEKLVTDVGDGIVHGRKFFVLHWHPLLAPIGRGHVEPVLDDLSAEGGLPLDQVVVGQHGASALHCISGGILPVFETRELAAGGKRF